MEEIKTILELPSDNIVSYFDTLYHWQRKGGSIGKEIIEKVKNNAKSSGWVMKAGAILDGKIIHRYWAYLSSDGNYILKLNYYYYSSDSESKDNIYSIKIISKG